MTKGNLSGVLNGSKVDVRVTTRGKFGKLCLNLFKLEQKSSTI